MAEPGALLADRYRLVRQVGSGGMGIVWEARDERLERPVAIKQLRPQVGLTPEEAELAKNRAMREARITARLHHRNAVPVFDVVEHEGQPCLVMQFLPCVPLSRMLREDGPLSVPEAARVGAQVASALAAAHRLDIVHRDVKPGNILVADDGTALISDFGISHALGDATLTSTGMVHGTPAYLAPEVARGGDSGFASDVFSLGATLYAALEGRPPFGTDANSIALLYKVASGEFAPPQRAGALAPVLTEMLRSDPDARPSMKEAASRLAAVEAADGVAPATLPLPVAEAPPAPPEDPTTVARVSRPEEAAAVPPVAGPPAAAPPAAAPPAAVRPPDPSPRPAPPTTAGRRSPWVLVAVVLLVSLGVLGTVLVRDRLGGSAAGPATTGTSTSAAPADPSSAGAETSATSAAPSSGSPAPSTATPSPSATPTRSSGEPTKAELEDAITGYYALVPGNTDEAWKRLTPGYQRSPSGGRRSYQRFWDEVERVSVSQVKASPPSRVDATVTYRRSGGRVSTERTSFRLVREDGVLKIAGSSVLSSS